MGEAERATIRLRHYTRTSSKERILAEGRIIARDQNKVFVERADRPPLSARQAEAKYLLSAAGVTPISNSMPYQTKCMNKRTI